MGSRRLYILIWLGSLLPYQMGIKKARIIPSRFRCSPVDDNAPNVCLALQKYHENLIYAS